MNESFVRDLESDLTDNIESVLEDFVKCNSDVYLFPFLNKNGCRSKVWKIIFSHLQRQSSPSVTIKCLSALRILSRDKTDLESLLTKERIEILTKCAELTSPTEITENNKFVVVESLKCLCNILFNEKSIVGNLESLNIMESLIVRLSNISSDLPDDLKLFDMKLVFLLTALSPNTRVSLYSQQNGLLTLCQLLKNTLLELNKSHTEADNKDRKTLTVAEEETKLKFSCEILKTLFNMISQRPESELSEHQKPFSQLVEVLRDLLLYESKYSCPAVHNMQSDVINLLTLLPMDCYKVLLVPGYSISDKVQIDNPAMKSVTKIIDFLDKSLSNVEAGKRTSVDVLSLSPVLLTLLRISKSDRLFRKHLRKVVLPNLTDVFKRPEDGETLRNKLCRLLTSPVTPVTNLTADWLFVLCKENVGRMVKYTGYGNAAGLFARRGFLGSSQNYSSDSETSDTEEYLEHKDKINPVVGCRLESHPNPLDNMTYEQKEFLAMDLVDKIDKLQRGGIIQPCQIGKDGRPQPVGHILELQQGLPEQIEKIKFHNDSE